MPLSRDVGTERHHVAISRVPAISKQRAVTLEKGASQRRRAESAGVASYYAIQVDF